MTNICLFGLIKLNANHHLVSWKKCKVFYTDALEHNEPLFGSLSLLMLSFLDNSFLNTD